MIMSENLQKNLHQEGYITQKKYKKNQKYKYKKN